MSASLRVEDLTIRFGGHVAVDAVSCAFQAGELTAIVGPNGAGKTTCFNLISGQLRPTNGHVYKSEREITNYSASARAKAGIGRAFQLTNLFPKLSVLENVRLAVQAQQGLGPVFFRRTSTYRNLRDAAFNYLQTTRLDDKAALPVTALSHGDQRKLEIALLLALKPDIFMFDEPTAGMSVDEAPVILELIENIRRDRSKAILLVEHKMDVVRSLADRIIVLHNGALVADGKPDAIIALPLVRDIYLGMPAEQAS